MIVITVISMREITKTSQINQLIRLISKILIKLNLLGCKIKGANTYSQMWSQREILYKKIKDY